MTMFRDSAKARINSSKQYPFDLNSVTLTNFYYFILNLKQRYHKFFVNYMIKLPSFKNTKWGSFEKVRLDLVDIVNSRVSLVSIVEPNLIYL